MFNFHSLEGLVPVLPKICSAGPPSTSGSCPMHFRHSPVLLSYSKSVLIVNNQSTLTNVRTPGNIEGHCSICVFDSSPLMDVLGHIL